MPRGIAEFGAKLIKPVMHTMHVAMLALWCWRWRGRCRWFGVGEGAGAGVGVGAGADFRVGVGADIGVGAVVLEVEVRWWGGGEAVGGAVRTQEPPLVGIRWLAEPRPDTLGDAP